VVVVEFKENEYDVRCWRRNREFINDANMLKQKSQMNEIRSVLRVIYDIPRPKVRRRGELGKQRAHANRCLGHLVRDKWIVKSKCDAPKLTENYNIRFLETVSHGECKLTSAAYVIEFISYLTFLPFISKKR